MVQERCFSVFDITLDLSGTFQKILSFLYPVCCAGKRVGVGRPGAALRSEKHLHCVFPPPMTICFQTQAGSCAVYLQDVLLRSKGKGEGKGKGRAAVFTLERTAQNHWQAGL